MRCMALVLPSVVFCLTVMHAWREQFAKEIIAAGVFLIIWSCLLARFLWRRAHGREAWLIDVGIGSGDDDGRKESVELMALAMAVLVMILALMIPALK